MGFEIIHVRRKPVKNPSRPKNVWDDAIEDYCSWKEHAIWPNLVSNLADRTWTHWMARSYPLLRMYEALDFTATETAMDILNQMKTLCSQEDRVARLRPTYKYKLMQEYHLQMAKAASWYINRDEPLLATLHELGAKSWTKGGCYIFAQGCHDFLSSRIPNCQIMAVMDSFTDELLHCVLQFGDFCVDADSTWLLDNFLYHWKIEYGEVQLKPYHPDLVSDEELLTDSLLQEKIVETLQQEFHRVYSK